MSGLNLHRLVRGPITRVNPDVPVELYVSTGSTTLKGIRTPTFTQVALERGQVQDMRSEELHHLNALNVAGGMSKLYTYGRLSSVRRPDGMGGDLVRVAGEWWAVQHVLEWWQDWGSVTIVRQVNADTLAALLVALANGSVPTIGGDR